MTPNNATVFLCSMKNFDKRLRFHGNGSLSEIMLLRLIYKYACYSPTYEILNKLDEMISFLQTSSDLICVNRIETGDFYPDYVDPFGTEDNTSAQAGNNPPTISNNTVNATDIIPTDFSIDLVPVPVLTAAYTFKAVDFQSGFTDADGDSQGSDIIIATLPSTGELRYEDVAVTANQIITDATKLVYFKIVNTAISETFDYRVSDDNANNPAFSNQATITLNVVASGNDAPTIGDNTIYPANNVTTVLTVAMFSSQLSPAYSDPEGDLLDAIRVDEISTANQGQYLYLGLAVAVGQVITNASLTAGDFVHVGANVNTITSDVINFSVRDTGSLTWVS